MFFAGMPFLFINSMDSDGLHEEKYQSYNHHLLETSTCRRDTALETPRF